MPHCCRLAFAKSIAFILRILDKKRKKDLLANLDFAYNNTLSKEQKLEILRTNYLNLVYNIIGFFMLSVSKKKHILKSVEIENSHIAQELLSKGENFISVTAHFGNWEYITPTFTCFFNHPINAIARLTPYPLINEYLFRVREKFNITIVDKMGAAPKLMRLMKNGESIGIVSDQNTSKKDGLLVDFFGKKVRHTPIASILARRFDKKIIPCFIYYSNDYSKHILKILPPITYQKSENLQDDIQKLTQIQSDILEKVIRENPKEWLWFHKKFKNQYPEIYKENK